MSRWPRNLRPQVRPRVVPTVPEQPPSIAVRRDERPARSSSEPGRCRQAPLSDGRLAANGGQPMQLIPSAGCSARVAARDRILSGGFAAGATPAPAALRASPEVSARVPGRTAAILCLHDA